MKIYRERIPYATFSDIGKPLKGELFRRLVGVNLTSRYGQSEIEPVYYAPLRWDASRGYLWIELGWSAPRWTIVIASRRPFLQLISVADATVYEEE
jgi:hypothetical protein